MFRSSWEDKNGAWTLKNTCHYNYRTIGERSEAWGLRLHMVRWGFHPLNKELLKTHFVLLFGFISRARATSMHVQGFLISPSLLSLSLYLCCRCWTWCSPMWPSESRCMCPMCSTPQWEQEGGNTLTYSQSWGSLSCTTLPSCGRMVSVAHQRPNFKVKLKCSLQFNIQRYWKTKIESWSLYNL